MSRPRNGRGYLDRRSSVSTCHCPSLPSRSLSRHFLLVSARLLLNEFLPRIEHLIDLAIEEDAGLGDVTSRAIFSARDRSRGFIDAKQDLVVCGLGVAARVFERVDPALKVAPLAHDGDRVKKGRARA